MPFSAYRDNFDAETLAILEAAFNEAWEVVTASGGDFDQETTRNALAELIISTALPIEIFGDTGAPAPRRLSRTASRIGNSAKEPENQGFLRNPDHLFDQLRRSPRN